MKRKLFNRFDILILAVLSVTVLVLCLRGKSEKRVAVVAVDGKTVYSVDLNTAEDAEFSLKEAPDVTIMIKNGSISFVNAKCRDKTCEKSGALKKAGDTAACLPNKTVITVSGKSDGFDGVSY